MEYFARPTINFGQFRQIQNANSIMKIEKKKKKNSVKKNFKNPLFFLTHGALFSN